MTSFDYSSFRASLSVAMESLRSLEKECHFAFNKGGTRDEVTQGAEIAEDAHAALSKLRNQLDADVKVGGSK